MTAADLPDDAIEAALAALNDVWGEDHDWTSKECAEHILAAALPALRRHNADELASWEATAAELRRQLAGTNALLATAKAEAERHADDLRWMKFANEELHRQRQAVLDRIVELRKIAYGMNQGRLLDEVEAALGVPPA